MTRNALLWLVWMLVTLCAGVALAAVMYVGGSRDALLIGKTTGAHHQIEMACDACHTADFYATPKKTARAMNKACLGCHDGELKLSNDSHPVKKFRDPRNADVRAKLDALYCHTCHAEHKPEITRTGAVTQPMDYCSACHQEVYKNRPSHIGYGFETCATAGCHNFHDNTALYEDFLVKNAGGPDIKPTPVLALHVRERDPAKTLSASDAVAPSEHLTDDALAKWTGSAHAIGGVNCAGCHAPDAQGLEAISAEWTSKPGMAACQSCHKDQTRTFREGRHGMRFHPKLPKPRKAPTEGIEVYLDQVTGGVFRDQPLGPITVANARLDTLKPDAAHLKIGNCNTCHEPHDVDTKAAAVSGCLTCHDDTHTRNYEGSAHHDLWTAELAGARAGTGVSCASCHMPRIENRRGEIVTTHNQNAYLRPNEKMIRSVCLSCHSLDFAIDALADPELVERNFNGRPSVHIESIDWALKRVKQGP